MKTRVGICEGFIVGVDHQRWITFNPEVTIFVGFSADGTMTGFVSRDFFEFGLVFFGVEGLYITLMALKFDMLLALGPSTLVARSFTLS